ncbi:hypothetical protein QBC36DRAFT_391019 [Triangularia setosa]|uniref:DUF676 domain-containing protein n=1 Tax=Triangularia setosa TaxID=2587417 RepID=A0AAN6VYJ9_9PEZI|nr:hypothetical protein QBC36DRAFT_391019 [Podospora setosa]
MAQPKRMLIRELYTPKNCVPDLDLVLIHGLNGDPIETWRHQGSKKLWPQELLPDARPNTRVLSYGYNGDIYLNNSAANIRDMARSILSNLDTRRESNSKRPIIFVAHCLGGLIIKQALCFARAEPQFYDIGLSTKAVFFFGTPHSGADKKDWKRIAENFSALSPSPRSRRRAMAPLVDAITTSAPKLGKLCDDFVELTERYLIVTWYETVFWGNTKKCIVDQTSTRMMSGPDEVSLPVEADHVNVCRFSDKDDPTLQEILRFVRKALKEDEIASIAEARRSEIGAVMLAQQAQAGEVLGVQRHVMGTGVQQPYVSVSESRGLASQGHQGVLRVEGRDGGRLRMSRLQEIEGQSNRGIGSNSPRQAEAFPAMEVQNTPWRGTEDILESSWGTGRPNILMRVAGCLRMKHG